EQAEKQELSQTDFEALRLRLRQERSVPLLKSFGAWLEKQAASVLPKSPIAEAVGYARNQWAALHVYAPAGFLEIDNNAGERALRAVAIGRNYAEPLIMRSRQDLCFRLRPSPCPPRTAARGRYSA